MTKKKKDLKQILHSLKKNGYAIIEGYFNEDFCSKAIQEIENKINTRDFTINQSQEAGGDTRFYKFENVSSAAKKFSKDKFLLSIGGKYFGNELSTHFVLGGKLKYSDENTSSSGGGWHRDSDGIQFKAMVYLNDVCTNNGPFLFVTNSKNKDAKREPIENFNSFWFYFKRFLKYKKIKDPRYSENSIKDFFNKRKQTPIEIVASKGTVVLFDSSYIHRGKIIQSGVRYSLTNYYFKNDEKSKNATLRNFGHLFLNN